VAPRREFRLAERADTLTPTIVGVIAFDFRGVQYRVAPNAELRLRRAELTEVQVREKAPGEYGLTLVVDRSVWTTIESITTAYVGNYLALFVDGNLVLAAFVETPVPDGRIDVGLYGRSKEEVFSLARRFSERPGFVPLESAEGR